MTQSVDSLELIGQGKTKQIFKLPNEGGKSDLVLVKSKDTLTAFNAKRKNEVEGKAVSATQTTINVFKYLNALGCPTHFVSTREDPTEFIAEDCAMVPIEWVARRIATGSFLKRHPGINEGYIFSSLKIETFFKDDANDDPQWSDDQILAANFEFNGLKIGKNEISFMKRVTDAVFRVLEKAWKTLDCALVDMKIEFGVTKKGRLVLADVIDNDSWRVWPGGDRRLQLDKQFYRDLKEVTDDAIIELKKNYERVAQLTKNFLQEGNHNSRILVVAGSGSDKKFVEEAKSAAQKLGVSNVDTKICSAHKTTAESLDLVADYENGPPTVVICIAGRSNGLGPVLAANSTIPVINAPNVGADWAAQDIWSSLRMPAGIGCTTVLNSSEAALAAARILSSHDYMIFGKILFSQIANIEGIFDANRSL
ncbi:hypothetical protein FO519_005860 [Halicephalobus sp. NKZ332]|nr:hypothetical protein FO519_005860 [Halicephalobus sp. NKZ332]